MKNLKGEEVSRMSMDEWIQILKKKHELLETTGSKEDQEFYKRYHAACDKMED